MSPRLTAELVCEYVTKEMWETGQLSAVSQQHHHHHHHHQFIGYLACVKIL